MKLNVKIVGTIIVTKIKERRKQKENKTKQNKNMNK